MLRLYNHLPSTFSSFFVVVHGISHSFDLCYSFVNWIKNQKNQCVWIGDQIKSKKYINSTRMSNEVRPTNSYTYNKNSFAFWLHRWKRWFLVAVVVISCETEVVRVRGEREVAYKKKKKKTFNRNVGEMCGISVKDCFLFWFASN